MALQFKPDWKSSVLVLLLLPLLVGLGFWQLQREQEKLQILARFQARLAETPAAIESLAVQNDLAWRRVTLSGEFDANHTYLLDNQIRAGRVGFDVLQPFSVRGGQMLVWVNRGWLEGKRLRSELPAVKTPAGQIEVNGYIYVPDGNAFSLEDTDSALNQGWPRVIQSVSVPGLAAGANAGQVFAHVVRLSDNSPAALQADWPTISVQPAKHRGYAVQWFCMAVALLLFYLLHNSNLSQILRARS
ncbi:MAG: SURF1 family protein [Pseudomonadales bacterium]